MIYQMWVTYNQLIASRADTATAGGKGNIYCQQHGPSRKKRDRFRRHHGLALRRVAS
jgi:hypothetical protein